MVDIKGNFAHERSRRTYAITARKGEDENVGNPDGMGANANANIPHNQEVDCEADTRSKALK